MEKLMKPAEYAKELGISRQAVYAKIKRGILTAKNVEGKLYIVVDKNTNDDKEKKETVKTESSPSAKKIITKPQTRESRDYKALLAAKEETISVLKGTVKDLKKSNKQISSTLKGEIDLLKEAFYEMRTLYVRQLEQKMPKVEEIIEVEETFEKEDVRAEETAIKEKWIGLKKFFKIHDIVKKKDQSKIIKRLSKAFRKDDSRLKNISGKLKLNVIKEYGDILK